MLTDTLWTLVICMVTLAIAGLGSLGLVIVWYRDAPAPLRRKLLRRTEELHRAWRTLEALWRRGRRGDALARGLLSVWCAYVAWKRASLVGAIDLTIVRAVVWISTVSIGWDLWRFLWMVFEAWQDGG